MARIALGGSFRTIRSYGTDSVGSYLQALRLEKQRTEDSYFDQALNSGDETPEAVLTYWQNQKDRFAPGSIDYKTYTSKIKNIQSTIDTAKVNTLLADKKFDEAINYYTSSVLNKYEKDTPAWSDAFVKLQGLKDSKTSNDISMQEAKMRAKWSVGGLSGKNLVSYYTELVKYMQDSGLEGREEYFKAVEGQNTAVAQAGEQEKQKETARFNTRLNELIGERQGVITSKDWVDIYSKMAGEFSPGSEGYATALEQLTKASGTLKTDTDNQRKQQSQLVMNTVLQKYAEGGITDQEYAQALQEALPMMQPGSEEANTIARQLGNLQETLGKQGQAQAEQEQAQKLVQQITQLEVQAQQTQAKFESGLMDGTEYDTSREQFLKAVSPLYEQYGQISGDQGVFQKMAEYGQEIQTLPEKMQMRQTGQLIDRVTVDSQGNRKIESVNLQSIDPLTVGNTLDVITDKGIQQFTFKPLSKETGAGVWVDGQGNQFAKIATTKEARDNFALPAGIKPQQALERVTALDQAMQSGQQIDFKAILNPPEQAKGPSTFQTVMNTVKPAVSNIAQGFASNISNTAKQAITPSIAGFSLPELPKFELPKLDLSPITSSVGNWLTKNVWDTGSGTAKAEGAIKNIGSTIANTAKNLWQGFKQKTSSISPWW
jgi:uncharacterized membrane protein